MQIQTGAEDTWVVSSVNGRIVASFTVKQNAVDWIGERKDTGVNYRLFAQRTDTQEIQPY